MGNIRLTSETDNDMIIDIVGAATNGYVLTYNSSTRKWTPQAAGAGGGTVQSINGQSGATLITTPNSTMTLGTSSTTTVTEDINLTNANTWSGLQSGTVRASSLATGAVDAATLVLSSNAAAINLSNANTWAALQTFGNNISFGGATLSISGIATGNGIYYNGTNWINLTQTSPNSTISVTNNATTNGVDINLGHANTWTGVQTFQNAGLQKVMIINPNNAPSTGSSSEYDDQLTISSGGEGTQHVVFGGTPQTGVYCQVKINPNTIDNPSTAVITNASAFRVTGAVQAGTNTTLTNAWSMFIDDGNVLFGGSSVVYFSNKQLVLGSTGGNHITLTTGTLSSQTTLTLPNVTDTVMTIGTNQTLTGVMTFPASGIILTGSSTGVTTFTSANAGASNYTLTLPAVNDTVAVIGTDNGFTSQQTFNNEVAISKANGTGAFSLSIVPDLAPTGTASAYVSHITETAHTINFQTTAQSSNYYQNRFNIITLTNPSGNTIGTAATLQIDSAPVASTNVTITNAYAINVGSGTSNFQGVQVSAASGLTIVNPAGSHYYTIVPAAITAARSLTLPLITGTDTLACLGLAQTFSATITHSAAIALTGSSPSISTYNNIATAGVGVPFLVAAVAPTTYTGTQSNVINYAPPSAAGMYRMTISLQTSSGTNTGSTTPSVAYKSAKGVSQTFAPNFMQTGSATLLTAPTGSSLAFSSVLVFGIDNSGTAITLTLTVSGTVAADYCCTLEQMA